MKLFKKRNIQALIYGLFMLLPFCAILARVIYVQSNKNAYESYYGETINQTEYDNINVTELKQNNEYYIFSGNYTLPQNYEYIFFYTTKLTNLNNNTTYNNQEVRIFTQNNDIICRIVSQIDLNLTTGNVQLAFTYDYTDLISTTFNLEVFYTGTYNQYSYLDNVFEYSVNKFVDDNNFGNFDFFQWFSTFFLQDNVVNNLYVHFINWYMNYMLYVSLGYLIFSILMWFVNFFRSLVEKSTDLNL